MVKCEICEKEIETTFLDKLNGTIKKVKKGDKVEKVYICSECQKQGKDKNIK